MVWLLRSVIGILLIAAGLWVANTSLFSDRSHHRTKLLAHRGVHHVYVGRDRSSDACQASPVAQVEHSFIANTLPSMREAFRLGADAVEIDVHLTRDNRFAVFHDWTLDCRTNGSGVTREHTVAELKALDVGYRIDDGSGRFPLRGRGVGEMPLLRELLQVELPGRVLVNFKSNDAQEGLAFAQLLQRTAQDETGAVSKVMGVYGGAPPTEAALRELPALRGYTRASVRHCLSRYFALGWSGYVPSACRNGLIAVPLDYTPYLWGWPHRFTARMKAAGTDVILLGPYDGSGYSSGIDDEAALARVPERFNGYVWTNRIEVIGPALGPAR